MRLGSTTRKRAETLLGTIRERWTSDESGGLRSTDWAVTFLEAALVRILATTSDKLSADETRSCAYKALRATLKSAVCSVSTLESEFDTRVSELKARRRQTYYVVTRNHFSFADGGGYEHSLGGSRLTIGRSAPDGFDLSEFFVDGYGGVDLSEPFGGSFSVIEIMARSFDEAMNVGSDALAAHYGLLNFALLRRSLSHRTGKAQPVTPVFPGKEAGFFDDQKVRLDGVMYWTSLPSTVRSFYSRDRPRFEFAEKLAVRIHNLDSATQKYYGTFARLYFSALSESDIDNRLLRLWSVAEYLTFCMDQHQRGVAGRLTALWADRDVAMAVAETVQQARNDIIHGHSANHRPDDIAELFRAMVDDYVSLSLSVDKPSVRSWRRAIELSTMSGPIDEVKEAITLIEELRGKGLKIL